MIKAILFTLLFCLCVSQDCYTPGLQIAGIVSRQRHQKHTADSTHDLQGPILNEPERDKTGDAESCQLFCQTVTECTWFSWADETYSWEEYQKSCWLFSEHVVSLVDEHFISGPKYC